MVKIDASFFFREPERFPWEYMGLDYPVYGPSYLYLCRFMAKYEPTQQSFLLGKPTIRELRRYAETEEGLAKRIAKYVDEIDGYNAHFSPRTLQKEILDFAKDFFPFRADFEKRLERDVKLGIITLPPAAVIYIED